MTNNLVERTAYFLAIGGTAVLILLATGTHLGLVVWY